MQLIFADGDYPDAQPDAEVINSNPGTPYCHAVTLTAAGDISDDAQVSAIWALRDLHEKGRIEIGA